MYEACIGLEVHVELNTKTKAFCSCAVSFGEEPNKNVCPVCLGQPGALPTVNKKAVEYAVMLGMAMNCSVNKKSIFVRKNYFYPDLPKGYQISQGEESVCTKGYVALKDNTVRINRIHIEEDAGKLVHQDGQTLIDYNRAGVPLLEIVTEPDIKSAEEAREFLEHIKNTLLSLGISECRMERGHLRCDVNVSVRKKGESTLNERCEMKNVNSFSQVIRCIEYEIKRQKDILQGGGKIERETRKWDDEKQLSVPLRRKETESDYRFFPEPDLPMPVISEEWLQEIKKAMPELFFKKAERFKKEYKINDYEAELIATDVKYAEILDEAVNNGADAKLCANIILGDISRMVNERGIETRKVIIDGNMLAELAKMVKEGEISYTAAGKIVEVMFDEGREPKEIAKEYDLIQISDEEKLRRVVDAVVKENEKSVSDYKRGKTNALGYLVGRCMKATGGKANPTVVHKMLVRMLSD